jgi:hypothetical protein
MLFFMQACVLWSHRHMRSVVSPGDHVPVMIASRIPCVNQTDTTLLLYCL